MSCIFCEIVAGRSPASTIYEDANAMAFMAIRPNAPGECLIIPYAQVINPDLDDATAQRIILVAQRIGRRLRTVFAPVRVGMLVHGFGASHAHLILVPQHGPDPLTSDRCASVQNKQIVFSERRISAPERATLDEHTRLLAAE